MKVGRNNGIGLLIISVIYLLLWLFYKIIIGILWICPRIYNFIKKLLIKPEVKEEPIYEKPYRRYKSSLDIELHKKKELEKREVEEFRKLELEELKKELDELEKKKRGSHIDKKGYLRYTDTNQLIHRYVAYNLIYIKEWQENGEDCKYPLKFREYHIHHKDRNKLNNNVNNLQILTIKEHLKKHGIKRFGGQNETLKI